jgi:hypothetical protein
MATDKTGGPAFPCIERFDDGRIYMQNFGLTKREWYIGMALQGAAVTMAGRLQVMGLEGAKANEAKQLTAKIVGHCAIAIADAAIELEGKSHE